MDMKRYAVVAFCPHNVDDILISWYDSYGEADSYASNMQDGGFRCIFLDNLKAEPVVYVEQTYAYEDSHP